LHYDLAQQGFLDGLKLKIISITFVMVIIFDGEQMKNKRITATI
jgi:hypothetical protein